MTSETQCFVASIKRKGKHNLVISFYIIKVVAKNVNNLC